MARSGKSEDGNIKIYNFCEYDELSRYYTIHLIEFNFLKSVC